MNTKRNFLTHTHSLVIFILFLSLLIPNKIDATNYYVSATGNDGADGLTAASAWQSISKVNAILSNISEGSTIFFNRGDIFYGTIIIQKSGTSVSPITLSAYGTGAKPTITGFTTITGWTNEGGGIYSKVISGSTLTNMVTIDGKQVGMGRYPETGFMKYEYASSTSITDVGLGTTINWKGAGLAIRKNDWTLDRATITNHVGDVLTFSNLGTSQAPEAGCGYFIMNDLRTLTTYGEWYHNTSTGKFYMYFGTVDPNTKVVQVATSNNLVINSGAYDYITLDNLNLTGAINNAVYNTGSSDYCNIQNCHISFCGNNGIDLEAGTGCIIDNNSIRDCNAMGIYIYYSTSLYQITNNRISNIGIIPGQYYGLNGSQAISTRGNNGLISYNTIKKTGYNGIYLGLISVTVSYNYIDSVCLVLNDGGAIYFDHENTAKRLIDHNIITNVIGTCAGAIRQTALSEGIYMDELSTNVVVSNNIVGNSGNSGIKVHNAYNNTITDNTTFNCLNGIILQNSGGLTTYIHDITLKRNIFFAKTTLQTPFYFSTNTQEDITKFGIADSNYYTRPISEEKVFNLYQPSPGLGWRQLNLATWHALSSQDAHSKKSPIAVTNSADIRFVINPTKMDTAIILDGKYITVDSMIYNGSVTLKPFTSVILMKYTDTTIQSHLDDNNLIKVYPNPISNQFTVEINGDNNSYGFEILNSMGQVVSSGKITGKITINSSDLSQCIYFVKIKLGNNFVTKKFIKTKTI